MALLPWAVDFYIWDTNIILPTVFLDIDRISGYQPDILSPTILAVIIKTETAQAKDGGKQRLGVRKLTIKLCFQSC